MNYYPNNFYQPQIQSPTVKIVDGIDFVKGADVPFNSYGIFLKADMTEIYIKAWNSDATTKIITYIPTKNYQNDDKNSEKDIILMSLANLEKKIDGLKIQSSTPMKKKKVEVEDDE